MPSKYLLTDKNALSLRPGSGDVMENTTWHTVYVISLDRAKHLKLHLYQRPPLCSFGKKGWLVLCLSPWVSPVC